MSSDASTPTPSRTVLDTGVYVKADAVGRIELVDGLVWEAVGNVTSDNQVYHTGDCERLPAKVRSASRDRVIAWDRSECAYCAGTHGRNDGGDE